jgi:Flp pilus assembly pilin Flp
MPHFGAIPVDDDLLHPETILLQPLCQVPLGQLVFRRSCPMTQILSLWSRLKADGRGVTALEYGLIAGVIVAVVALGFGVLATDLSNEFAGIGGSL